MNLETALGIAKDCGLETIGEAILNIKLHAMSIFNYDDIYAEYKELCDDYKEYRGKYEYSFETRIDDIFKNGKMI
jgi:hypothetical protein